VQRKERKREKNKGKGSRERNRDVDGHYACTNSLHVQVAVYTLRMPIIPADSWCSISINASAMTTACTINMHNVHSHD